jgi:hypothetical protein
MKKWRNCSAGQAVDFILIGGSARNEDHTYEAMFCDENAEKMQLHELILQWQILIEAGE